MKNKTLTAIDKNLIHHIDQLIIDNGHYQAVELLLRMDLLAYAEYEQWRQGKLKTLCEIFIQQKNTIMALLADASLYVNSLKMIAKPLFLQQWTQNEAPVNLRFCIDNSALGTYLGTQYVRSEDEQQMDLFFDSQSLEITNELKQALMTRNIRLASQKFQALLDIEPGHEMVKPAKILLDALVNALEEEQINDTEQELHYLLNELAPVAQKTLAGQERDYMSLFWRRLASFSEISGDTNHPSCCYQQIPDWQAVIHSIEQTPDAMQSPELLARYALALRKSAQQAQYLQVLCQYYWQFFQTVQISPADEDPSLKTLWHEFQDLGLEEQWGRQCFPDWLLINKPGVSQHIVVDANTPETFKILQTLVVKEMQTKQPELALRQQLKKLHPELLNYYLKINS